LGVVSEKAMTRIGLVLSVLVVAGGVAAQTQTLEEWTVPRTPEGHPDLQGIWTSQTFTPLERPDRFAGREFLTEEEAATLTELLNAPGVDPLATSVLDGGSDADIRERLRQTDPTHYDNEVWLTTSRPKGLSSRRTSLVVDPPDGRIPPTVPAAQERARARRAALNYGLDSYENRHFQERCLAWVHEGPPMLPPPYNDLYQFFQVPGYVVIMPELSNNAVRIIPTDGRPHLPQTIRQWPGDSRGRWEGDALVVDTTNFTDKTGFRGSSDALHLVERFSRVDDDTILYEFTVEDPATWTRPWSVEVPMKKTEGPLYEYTCHEGNYGIPNSLAGARAQEQAAARAGTGAR
jgi:hypothetical protein